MMRASLWVIVVSALAIPAILHAAPFTLIVCGSGGEAQYETQFQDWGDRLRAVLIGLGHPQDHVGLLTETGEHADGRSKAGTILRRLEALKTRVGSGDNLFIYLIGHGSYRRAARLGLPGPDLTAEDISHSLTGFKSKSITIINTASTSGPFIRALGGEDRIVITSTESADEDNATRFAEYLIQGLEDGGADGNRDDRISVLEACRHAAALTAAGYTAEGLLATEHAVIDGNGDGRPTRLDALDLTPEGDLPNRVFLKDWAFPDSVPRAWIDTYRGAINRVEDWISRRGELAEEAYWEELEARLLIAAEAHRRIREIQAD
jgi:hypothetical protein